MIYTSEEAYDALPADPNFDEKFDFILSKHVQQMTADEYASVCNSIVGRHALVFGSADGVHFSTFLNESLDQAQSWLMGNDFKLSTFPSVVVAISHVIDTLENEKKPALVDAVETAIFENSRKISVAEAVDLVNGVASFASGQTMELLDRIIGNGIYELTAQ
jgi:hypothetical protein